MAHSDHWRVRPGDHVHLDRVDARSTHGAPGGGDEDETREATAVLGERLADLQGRLWAEGRRSLLVVLQAMDAGGKDGTVKHVFSTMNPMAVSATSFKAPSAIEAAHDFLWRISAALPARGEVGVFNRSHYEDVLVVRVEELVPEDRWRARYEAIRNFEDNLAAEGTTVVKLFLHISRDEQAERFRDRLEDPSKVWKFKAADLDVRAKWDQYQQAYADAIEQTSTEMSPWYVVPADRKWYRNWAVSTILIDVLETLDPQYPPPEDGLDGIVIT